MKPILTYLAMMLGGILVGAFLVVQDEILTLAMYCGRGCQYPYPLLGPFSLYDAESIAAGMIVLGIVLFSAGILEALLHWKAVFSTGAETARK